MSSIEADGQAERSTTSVGEFELDPAKLRPPRAPHATVGHERLLAMRPDSLTFPVVTVVAPAGYGKSTLLAEWVAHDPGRVLWLTLDPHDDDPVRLVAHIAAALLESGAQAPELAEGMRSPGGPVWSRMMPRLSAALQSTAPFTIVIDDAHAVTSAESWDVLDWIALHVPREAQMAIAGRSLGGSVMPRLRVDGLLATLESADLALPDAEALELLEAVGTTISPAEAARVNRACGGWAAGLLMSASVAVRSAQADADPAAHDDLLDRYLEAEVLRHLRPADREFIKRTSILRLASAPLCDVVLARSDSRETLERLCSSNTFITRVGEGWCRTHDLVRSALLQRMEERDTELVSTLRDRAAMWHAEHGSPAEAVQYSMESGHVDRTIDLIGRFANLLFSSGQWTLVSRWLDWTESQGLSVGSQSVMAAAVMGSALTGEPERSARWAEASGRTRTGEATVDEGLRALIAGWHCQRGADTMLADATRAEELIPDANPWRKSALACLGVALLLQGRDAESEIVFQRVVDEPGPAWPDTAARSGCMALLAVLALREQRLAEALELLERAAALRHESGTTEQGLQAFVDAVMARAVFIGGGGADDARGLLSRALRTRSFITWAMPSMALIARLELIKASLALGDVAAARVIGREAADILRRRPGLGVLEVEAHELAARVARQAETSQGPSSLTAAELRLMPWLASHLSFREIGERLFLSTNTVKTEALATYRKLGASSRSEAVEAAVRVGLLDPASLAGILGASTWTRQDSD